MTPLTRFWYVSPQRLCNFQCDYCVSRGDYAKSNKYSWRTDDELLRFKSTVKWLGTRPYKTGIRLASLGEPLATREFLDQLAWLTQQPNVEYVELLTNGSLLKRKLPHLASTGDIKKMSFWITYHHTETDIDRVIEAASVAQDQYGCFVVVNALLFSANEGDVANARNRALKANLRFNVDVGYDPSGDNGTYDTADEVAPLLASHEAERRAVDLGASSEVMRANLIAMQDVRDQPCSAGHDYFYIGIDSEIYPCSRYFVMNYGRLGNVLDPEFELVRSKNKWSPCAANDGCCNKEDFLNLKLIRSEDLFTKPSLGWVDR